MPGHGTFHWNELMTWDISKARAFYGDTLGWAFDAMPMPMGFTYTVAKSGGVPVAGMMPMDEERFKGVPEHWMSYIEVDDIDSRCAKVPAAGGTVITPPFDVEGVGRIAMIKDANNGVIGWITPAERG